MAAKRRASRLTYAGLSESEGFDLSDDEDFVPENGVAGKTTRDTSSESSGRRSVSTYAVVDTPLTTASTLSFSTSARKAAFSGLKGMGKGKGKELGEGVKVEVEGESSEDEMPVKSKGKGGRQIKKAKVVVKEEVNDELFEEEDIYHPSDDSDLSDLPDDIPLEIEVVRQSITRRNRQSRQSGGASLLNRAAKQRLDLVTNHPELDTLWEDLEKIPTIEPVQAQPPPGLYLKLLPFQLEGLNWLQKQEVTQFNGGILADEMGMGKTIQTIALLLTEPRGRPNLIVAPTVALMQWRSEIETHTDRGLTICIFHGANRELSEKKLKEFDVILTTYSVIESVFRKQQSGFRRKDGVIKEKSVLHSIQFFRIILDEAHNVKDRACNTARSVFALHTERKLCLSGTPLQNRIGELFSLLRFLETDPFSMYFCRKCSCKSFHWRFPDKRHCQDCGHRPMDHVCWFNMELLKPIQRNGAMGPGREAFKKMHKLLGRIMLRRTKVERADDLGLPPRIVEVRQDLFTEEEQDLYESIYSDSKRKFNTYVAQGVVLNNYANIFQLITRMRQLSCHPDLVLKRRSAEASNQFVCRLCEDEAQDAIRSRCHHVFCRLCIQEYIDSFAGGSDHQTCPVCHVPLSIDLTAPGLEIDEEARRQSSILNRIDMSAWRSSTKIEALMEELYKLRSKDCTIKSIVFSQFTSFLDLVHWRLNRAGFNPVKLQGNMSPTQREATINHVCYLFL